jgi:nucleotide-binding universal stress UspA family protein
LRKYGHVFKDKGIQTRALSAGGDPRKMIEEQIKKEQPDLVVMGKRGLGTVSSFFLGSVSNHVTQSCSTPIAVVP